MPEPTTTGAKAQSGAIAHRFLPPRRPMPPRRMLRSMPKSCRREVPTRSCSIASASPSGTGRLSCCSPFRSYCRTRLSLRRSANCRAARAATVDRQKGRAAPSQAAGRDKGRPPDSPRSRTGSSNPFPSSGESRANRDVRRSRNGYIGRDDAACSLGGWSNWCPAQPMDTPSGESDKQQPRLARVDESFGRDRDRSREFDGKPAPPRQFVPRGDGRALR